MNRKLNTKRMGIELTLVFAVLALFLLYSIPHFVSSQKRIQIKERKDWLQQMCDIYLEESLNPEGGEHARYHDKLYQFQDYLYPINTGSNLAVQTMTHQDQSFPVHQICFKTEKMGEDQELAWIMIAPIPGQDVSSDFNTTQYFFDRKYFSDTYDLALEAHAQGQNEMDACLHYFARYKFDPTNGMGSEGFIVVTSRTLLFDAKGK